MFLQLTEGCGIDRRMMEKSVNGKLIIKLKKKIHYIKIQITIFLLQIDAKNLRMVLVMTTNSMLCYTILPKNYIQ